MVGGEHDVSAGLLAEYVNAIDTSTLLAILSDYDLSDDKQVVAAREILDILRDSIPEDERTGFDPSATAGVGPSTDLNGKPYTEEGSVSAKSQPGWTSNTDSTSISQEVYLDLEGLDLDEGKPITSRDDSPESTYTSELDGLSEVEKETALIGIFPALKPFDINWTLKKCKWDAGLAIDELMTQSFLEESGSRHRGVEAFSESDVPTRSRKGKGKKKKQHLRNDYSFRQVEPEPPQSKWRSGKQDVEFISEKTGMPTTQISSLYHKSGASIRSTILAIIEAHRELHLDEEMDFTLNRLNASQLHQEFPLVSIADLNILLQITHPLFSPARDLAKALSSKPPPSTTGGIQIEFRHKPIEEEQENIKPPRYQNTSTNPESLDYALAISQVNNFHQARDTAYTQASSAYRKGKSDPLMSGAAAYYSQLARDQNDRAYHMSSAAADLLVARQSTKTQLDLHGVNVKDALRITTERVNAWWHGLGESRIAGRGGVGEGYRVVTGVGKHSEGGRGKLGPAVGKMLIREGWKVEVGSGVLVVTGVVRRK